MLTHEELLNKKAELESRKQSKEQDLKVKSSLRDSFINQLSNISLEEKKAIEKARNEALKEEIQKNTFRFDELIHKLNRARDEILVNRDKRLSRITYESYSKKLNKNLNIDEYVERCNELRDKLEVRQGSRLSLALERCIPTDKGVYTSLEDIITDFETIESLSDKLTVDDDILGKIEKFIFKYDTSELDKNKSYVFLVAILVIGALLILSGPVLVLLLCTIIIYNIYKSFGFYKSMQIVKNIIPNVNRIKESIDSGIKSKMNSDKIRIENKFKGKLDEVDTKIDSLEERIVDITESIHSDFSFDSSRVSESFRIKEKSLNDRLRVISQEYDDINTSIPLIVKEINEVNSQIVQLGKTIYNQYYPSDMSAVIKSPYYPNDILFDVVDNKPNLHKLTPGSSLYIYENIEDALNFIRLYFCTMYIQMSASSFTCSIFDTVYVGTKFLQFAPLNNFTMFTNNNDITSKLKDFRSEMLKRVSIIGNSSLDDYNREMLAEDSATLSYRLLLDLGSTVNNVSDEEKQLIKNGYVYGIIFTMFISQDTLVNDPNFTKTVLPYFDNVYSVHSLGTTKRSKKYCENLMNKGRHK